MNSVLPNWTIAPERLKPPDRTLHLWRVELAASLETLTQVAPLLSDEEHTRSRRLRFPQHQQRFILGRGHLRLILSRYLEMPPEQLEFCYGASGKPALKYAPTLQFNVSHSEDLMLCAIADQPIGVDLERLRPIADLPALTQRFFSPAEHNAIHALPLEQQQAAFFRYWTGKEAVLKAIGCGIGQLSAVELDSGMRLVRLDGIDGNWQLESFVPAVGYVAAIALNATPRSLTFLQLLPH